MELMLRILLVLIFLFGVFGCDQKQLSNKDVPIFSPKTSPLSGKGLDLIIYHETGGKDYYNLKLKYPTVPPGDSGCTWGVGFDGRWYSSNNIQKIWHKLGSEKTERLSKTSGLNHQQSINYLSKIKNILVEWELATEVFNQETVPDYYNLALRTFPGLSELNLDTQAAITSIVFNRGSSLTGPTRLEMRQLKVLIPNKDYKGMAKAVRDMKRLWVGKDMDGLLKRREAEARLIENSIK